MLIAQEIDAGTLTIVKLSELIDFNTKVANRLGIKLSWCFENGNIIGRIKDGNKTIWKKDYNSEHTHVIIARMHYDFYLYLTDLSDTRHQMKRRKQINDAYEAKQSSTKRRY
jgi:hypothetical protein